MSGIRISLPEIKSMSLYKHKKEKMKLELDAPNIGALEKMYINKALDSGYVSTVGPLVSEFEDKFAQYLGVKNAVSTQSGTAAIHIALYELGIGKGDEVIVPALTFVATVNPVVYVGAKPVFVDVDIGTWNMSSKEVEKAITKKTKAIIPVHLYGNPCRMDEIVKIAKKYDLFVIEDATESLGAKYKGKFTGTWGDIGCFSFNGNKIITTGGGGMVAGNDVKKLKHIKFLVNQARDNSDGYYHSEIGFNYRMTNIEAALGIAQLSKLDKFLKLKETFNRIYKKEFMKLKFMKFQKEYPESKSSYWLTSCIIEKDIDTPKFQNELRMRGIQSRRLFMPIVELPPYRKYKKSGYPNSYYIYKSGISFPSSTLNGCLFIKKAASVIKNLLQNCD